MAAKRPTIGFITFESITPYITQLWLGANDCAKHVDVNLITFPSHEQIVVGQMGFRQAAEHVDRLVDLHALDGLLIWTAGILQDHTYAAELLARYQAVPTISLGVDTPGVNRVLMDGYQGMVQLVSHLITNCGRRTIAFINGTPTNRDAQIRQQAYEDGLRQHGLPVRSALIAPGGFAWNSRALGRQAVCELLDKRGLWPDAIVAASDDLAIGAIEELQQRGIRLPEEISVTGFDDIPDCLSVYPALTTVAQSGYELAWRGVEQLVGLIQGRSTPACTLIQTELIIRQSCGAYLKVPSYTNPLPAEEQTAEGPTDQATDNHRQLTEHFLQARDNYRRIMEKAFVTRHLGLTVYPSPGKLDSILDAFVQAMLEEEPARLLQPVEYLVYQLREEHELAGWKQALLSLLDQFMRAIRAPHGAFIPCKRHKRVDYLAQVIQSKLALLFEQRAHVITGYHSLQQQQMFRQLHITSRSLLIPYDPVQLAATFAQQLPQIGIDLAYVAVRSSFEAPSDEVRLLVNYNHQANLAEAPVDRIYKAAELASGRSIIQDQRLSLLVIPLRSANIDAGFVCFSFGPRDYQLYMQLSSTLGYSLVNGLLLEQVRAHADQLKIHVEERTTDLRAANRQLQTEIAERRQIEQELERTRDQALEASLLKSEFLATMTHEIRTPMNGITGMTELLLDTPLDEDQRSYATAAHEESYKLLEIINSILDFSKIEAGKIILEEAVFGLAHEVQSVIRLLTPKAQSKGISLLSAIAIDVPQQVIGDAARLHQILINLVGNAVKFTETGEVVITIVRATPTTLPSASNGATPTINLQITVRDTGIGIDETTIPNLFKPFTQADSSMTRRYGGTGLGLAITHRLVELMGGDIQVVSQMGFGSKFIVTVPFRCHESSARRAKEGPTPTASHCLLVSHNDALNGALTSYLATWSIRAEIYATPHSGNASLLRHLYHLVTEGHPLPYLLIDQQSTKIEPITLARSLRADPLLAKVYLLLLTTNNMPTFQHQIIEAGFDGVITHPVTQSALYNLLAKRLQPEAPIHLSTAETPHDGLAPAAAPAGPLVLVAEDYATNQRLVVIQLKKLGYAAHIVEHGRAAVDAILNNADRYHLILMDWQMPMMDGLEATKKIRELEVQTGRHIPIIGMTANAFKGDRERCLEAGMDDYISKPVKQEELRRVLGEFSATAKSHH
ncbi:hypothetical protein BH10CHL1_BH10CHL1_31070 [soil metagenome]